MRRKQRPSDPKKKFRILDRFKGADRLRIIEPNTGLVSTAGPEGGGSIEAHDCSTLVLQAKPPKRKGKPRIPLTIFWHMPVINFDEKQRLEAEFMQERQPLQWQHVLEDTGRLDELQSIQIPPKKLVHEMLRYLETNGMQNSRIEATLLPGINTQVPQNDRHKQAMDAVNQTKQILQELKENGRVHRIRTRGFSPHSDTIGSRIVWVDETGTIHRQFNRKRSSDDDILH